MHCNMEDQSAIFDVLPECSVCFDKLDVTSRVLPCQHTFCMRCLQQIIDARNELRCPECREHVPVRQVTELPTNILLVRILDGLKRPAVMTRPKSMSPPGSRSTKHSEAPGSSRGVHVKNSSSPQPCVKSLYKYTGQEPMDLSFGKGVTILLRRKIDDNWYQGELNGTVGFFPASYVQVITPLPPEPPQCKALYDFEVNEQNDKDCLTFLKDEVLKVIRRIDQNWVEGQRGDKIGIFPLSFVELNGSAKTLIDSQAPSGDSAGSSDQSQGSGDADQGNPEASSSSKNKSANKRHSFTSLLTQKSSKEAQSSSTNGNSSSVNNNNRHSMEISSPVLVRSSNPTAAILIDNMISTAATVPTAGAAAPGAVPSGAAGGNGRKKPAPLTITQISATAASNERPPNSPTLLTSPTSVTGATITSLPASPKPKVEVFVAMYSYKPQKADELELRKNEFYTVNEKCKDGWFKGMSLRTGELGVFPGNYMQPYRHDRVRKTSTTTASTEAHSSSPQVSQPLGSPRHHPTTDVTMVTTTSPTSQVVPTVRVRSPGTTPTNSTTTQTPLCGMSGSSSSTTLRAVAEGQGTQKRPTLITIDGQKTVAQLQSERAAQLMHYYQPQTNNGQAQSQANWAQGVSHGPTVPNRMSPSSAHQERPRGSPPTVSSQQGSASTRTNTTPQQTVMSRATPASHNVQAARTVSAVQRVTQNAHSGVQTPNTAIAGARTKTSAQLVSGSPPEHPSASHGMSRSRGQSGSPVAVGGVPEVASEGHSNGQTAVVSSNSTAVQRSSPSNAPSPGQQVVKQGNSLTASAKTKRLSAHIPLTALHAVDAARLHPQKPRRYSDSDHNPDRPRVVTRSTLQTSHHIAQAAQFKHAGVTAASAQQVRCDAMPVTPPIVPVRDSASMLPSLLAVPKVEKRDKRDKKTKRVPRPAPLSSDETIGIPVVQVRTNSLPENQLPAEEDLLQQHRLQNPDTAAAQGTEVNNDGMGTSAEEGAVGGAAGQIERRDKPPKTTPLVRERYRVVVPYPPQSEAELELKTGDTVYVHNKRSDGWFKGTLERTGKTGLFPSTFVESY